MDIPFSQRLSVRQTRQTVLVAFLLAGLLGLLQMAIDYARVDAQIDHEAHTLLAISSVPAARLLDSRDAPLASELLHGLLQAPMVVHAELLGSGGTPLSSARRPALDNGWQRQLSDLLFGSRRSHERPLQQAAPRAAHAALFIEIDTFAYGQPFLQRAGVTLARTLLACLLLSLILLGLYHLRLTRPLASLIDALERRDPQQDNPPALPCPPGHQHDEFGLLVNACNRQLDQLGREITQRRAAEQRLSQALGELEARVQERTLQLESSNRTLLDANRELQQAQHASQEMARARTQFFASMSHEIRTPLNGLLGMLGLALDSPMSAQLRQQLSIAHDSGRGLVELLNSLLDLSKFESGHLELEQTPFDLASLVEDSAGLLAQNAAPGVELTCLIDPELPAELIGDPLRVRQIVSNLLSNALKFTRHGRVDLRLSGVPAGVLLEVRDTGIGIAREALARIFQPFAQAEAGTSRQFGGTGLGLSLTRRLCEAMGGTLEVDSTPGLGSRFSVHLPLPGHAAATRLPALHGRVVALSSRRSGLSELLQTWLPHWGIDYRRLDTDASLRGVAADLLISDCPECLYARRPLLDAPILLVSAYASFLPDEEAERLQPLEQLARPLARAALYQALQRHLPDSPALDSPPTTARAPRILLVEDNPVNQLVVKGLLAKLGLNLEIARQGEEALKLLAGADFDLVLMDCNMPVMNGYEATRQIRSHGRQTDLPVIALTANVMPDERERCRQAGMNDYLSKPLRREELQAVLERWLPAGSLATD